MEILAVIPARAGSKGIPRKNMRLLSGKPLIDYSLDNATACDLISDIVVTTDSEEILSYVAQRGDVFVLKRDARLSGDSVTLDPVVYDALSWMENTYGKKYDAVITLQATSPLLSSETLHKAISFYLESTSNTCISVCNDPHLDWIIGENNSIIPGYEKRLNRQSLPPQFKETGAFLIADRESITETSRIGEKVEVFEVPLTESIDIDTVADWCACEAELNKKRIVFRADGHKTLGMGHIYRVLTLAYNLTAHDVVFVCQGKYPKGIELLNNANMMVVVVENDADFISWLSTQKYKVDIVVCDQLDTTSEYVDELKRNTSRVVCFEDLGTGAFHADAVINALYAFDSSLPKTFYTGEKYVCLRDEFLLAVPKKFSEEVKRIFVMFGGSDPLDLTSRIYDLAIKTNRDKVHYCFDFVLGLSYENNSIVSLLDKGINVYKNASRVSDYMKEADLAFSSQGRSMFELASLGVPAIILAQNDRETTHCFAEMANGFLNLGLGSEVSDSDIERTFEWLVNSPNIRYEMHRNMLKNDLKAGIRRVINIILGETF